MGNIIVLTCECDHARHEHDAGNTTCSDFRVSKCNHQNCTCKAYRADKNTRHVKTDIVLASCTIPAIIGAIALFGLIISFVAIDSTIGGFDVKQKIEVKQFENGKEIPYKTPFGFATPEPKDLLAFNMKSIVGFVILVGGLFSGMLYGMSYYEGRLKTLIKESAESTK